MWGNKKFSFQISWMEGISVIIDPKCHFSKISTTEQYSKVSHFCLTKCDLAVDMKHSNTNACLTTLMHCCIWWYFILIWKCRKTNIWSSDSILLKNMFLVRLIFLKQLLYIYIYIYIYIHTHKHIYIYICIIVLEEHCGIYKSSYNISNISYLNSPLPQGWG
jgi:hypothetical protein